MAHRLAPPGFQTLAVHGAALKGIYNHESSNHLAPGPDGRTVYTGRGGVVHAEGKPSKGGGFRRGPPSELTIPSPDPAYFLGISGLNDNLSPHLPLKSVAASVNAAGDGTRLLIAGLDKIDRGGPNESSIQDDFTVEKRFHLIPAANLLITIPFSNDRLVVHRLDIGKALDQFADDRLVVTSSPILEQSRARPSSSRSMPGRRPSGLKYTLVSGPDGLTVSPTGRLSWPSPRPPGRSARS